MLMSLDRREEVINYTRCKSGIIHVIITSTLLLYPLCFAEILEKKFFFAFILFIFALFAVSYNKMKILLRIYLIISVKKKKKGNK